MKVRILSAASTIVAGAVLLAAPARAQSLNGYTIAMTIAADSGRPPITMTLKAAGPKLRVDMDGIPGLGGGGGGGGLPGGLFFIPQDSNKVTVVLPAMGMGMSMDMSTIAGAGRGGRSGGRGGRGRADPMGTVANGIPEITDVSATVEDLGASESILGHPTHKYRIHAAYSANGEKHDDVSDTWFATDLAGADEGFGKFFTTFGAAFGGVNSSTSVAAAVRAKLPKGFPLRVIQKSDTPNGPGTTTIEASEVTRTTFDAADFEVPANIQLMDAGNMMGGRRGGKKIGD